MWRPCPLRDEWIVEEGPRDAVRDRPADRFTRELLAATPTVTFANPTRVAP